MKNLSIGVQICSLILLILLKYSYVAIATVVILTIILIVCTGTTVITNGRNYIGIAENQEIAVAM